MDKTLLLIYSITLACSIIFLIVWENYKKYKLPNVLKIQIDEDKFNGPILWNWTANKIHQNFNEADSVVVSYKGNLAKLGCALKYMTQDLEIPVIVTDEQIVASAYEKNIPNDVLIYTQKNYFNPFCVTYNIDSGKYIMVKKDVQLPSRKNNDSIPQFHYFDENKSIIEIDINNEDVLPDIDIFEGHNALVVNCKLETPDVENILLWLNEISKNHRISVMVRGLNFPLQSPRIINSSGMTHEASITKLHFSISHMKGKSLNKFMEINVRGEK